MVEEESADIKQHIKKQLAKGYTPKNIRTSLIYSGFSRRHINQAFREIEKETLEKPKKPVKKEGFFAGLFKKPKAEKPKEEKPVEVKKEIPKKVKKEIPKKVDLDEISVPKPKKPLLETKHKKILAYLVILLIIIICVAALVFLFLVPVSCATEQCFIDRANQCEQATFRNTIEGTSIYYETNNCVLTKTITALDPEEPPEVVEAFLGKTMTCRYQMNNFNPMYVSTISALVNTCQGPLRTAILAYSI